MNRLATTSSSHVAGAASVVAAHRRRQSVAALGRPAIVIACAALALAYLVTRLVYATRFPYFFDEGTYAKFTAEASQSRHQLFVSLTIAREPLQIWLGIPWVKLGLDPLTAMRAVSVTSGLLTVGVVGLLGRRLGGTTVALVAAALCVVLPLFVVHDGIGIYEPLVTLIVAGALLAQIELARRPDLRLGVALGVVFGASVLTKRNTEPAVALLPLSLLCFDWSAQDRRRRLKIWLGAVAIALAGVVVAEVLMRSSSYWKVGDALRRIHFDGVRPLNDVLSDPFGLVTPTWRVVRDSVVGYVTIPLLVAAAAGGALGLFKRRRMTLLLLAWTLVPLLVILTFTTQPYPRHVMALLPPAIVLAAYGLVTAGRWVREIVGLRPAVIICGIGLVLVLAPALVFDARVLAHPATFHYPSLDDRQYVTGDEAGSPWPALTAAIRRRAKGDRVVIITPNSYPDTAHYLLWPDRRFIFPPYGSRLAASAQFAIENHAPFFDPGAFAVVAREHFVVVGRFPRPRGGVVATLLERPPGQ